MSSQFHQSQSVEREAAERQAKFQRTLSLFEKDSLSKLRHSQTSSYLRHSQTTDRCYNSHTHQDLRMNSNIRNTQSLSNHNHSCIISVRESIKALEKRTSELQLKSKLQSQKSFKSSSSNYSTPSFSVAASSSFHSPKTSATSSDQVQLFSIAKLPSNERSKYEILEDRSGIDENNVCTIEVEFNSNNGKIKDEISSILGDKSLHQMEQKKDCRKEVRNEREKIERISEFLNNSSIINQLDASIINHEFTVDSTQLTNHQTESHQLIQNRNSLPSISQSHFISHCDLPSSTQPQSIQHCSSIASVHMFRSLRSAFGLGAISDDDSSESDFEDAQEKPQDSNNEQITLTDKLVSLIDTSPNLESKQESDPKEETKSVVDSLHFKNCLGSVPREQLVGIFARTRESVRYLREMLEEEFRIRQQVEEEHQLLKDHVDQLGQLMTKIAQSEGLSRKLESQPIINVDGITDRMEQVSNVATNYAIPLVKNVFQNLVSQFGKSLESNDFVGNSRRIGTKSRFSSRSDSRSKPPTVITERINGGNHDWQNDDKEEESKSSGNLKSSTKILTNAFINAGEKLIQEPSESQYLRQVSVPANPVFKLASDDAYERRQPSHGKKKSLTSKSPSPKLQRKPQDTVEPFLQDGVVWSMSNQSALVHPISEIINSPSHHRIPTILEVVVILDKSPHSGSRSSFRVLATDSIVDAVNNFSQQYKLSSEIRTSLIAYLEDAEEAANCFPAKVEVALSTL